MKFLPLSYMIALPLAVVLSCGCGIFISEISSKKQSKNAVLSLGDVIEFKNPNGCGRIICTSEFTRRYEIEKSAFNVKLIQRDKESLYRTGLYNPGESWGSPSIRSSPRFVLDESVLRFQTMVDAAAFFKLGHREEKWVFGHFGLAIG